MARLYINKQLQAQITVAPDNRHISLGPFLINLCPIIFYCLLRSHLFNKYFKNILFNFSIYFQREDLLKLQMVPKLWWFKLMISQLHNSVKEITYSVETVLRVLNLDFFLGWWCAVWYPLMMLSSGSELQLSVSHYEGKQLILYCVLIMLNDLAICRLMRVFGVHLK